MTEPKKRTIKGSATLRNAWDTAEFEAADIGAIKAMVAGTANEHQQQRVVEWLRRASGLGEMSFRPGPSGDRETAFAEGKRFVGMQFFTLALATLPPRESSNAAP